MKRLLLLCILAVGSALAPAQSYELREIKVPDGERLEVGGIDFLPDGRMAVSTRRGRVWLITDPARDGASPEFQMFAEGMQDCLGLAVIDGLIHVVQRGEMTRLIDTDDDGRADVWETVTDDWGVSGNYHEYAFGLPADNAGNHYISLNVPFLSPKWWLGASHVPYRGWVMKVAPDGSLTPFASGFRSPCGIGRNKEGEIFVTDNQGDWMPVCPLFHVEEGRFYGHPASLRWTREYQARQEIPSQIEPPPVRRTMPALWLPYNWSRSAGQMVTDETGGGFGPFTGQMFISELTNGNILRASLEKVRGRYQGAVFMFQRGVGSAVRLAWAADNSLVIGRTNRGWGGLEPGDGLARLVWNGKVPFDMLDANLTNDGFRVTFTKPLKEGGVPTAENIKLLSYDYNYWWEYGSPEVNQRPLMVEGISLSQDRKVLTFRVPGLRAGRMVRATFAGVESADGDKLENNEFSYTVNELRTGEPAVEVVAKTVPPPAAKESPYEGWLYLNKIKGGDRWNHDGWEVVSHAVKDIVLDPADAKRILVVDTDKPAAGADGQSSPNTLLSGTDPAKRDAVCKVAHGAIETWFDVFVPKGGSASVFFQGRYELRFTDDPEAKGKAFALVPPSGTTKGVRPPVDAYRGPGKWHVVHMKFSPPRFDDEGKKFLNATFEDVAVDGALVHESVEISDVTPGAPVETEGSDERPLVLRANNGQAAFRRISMKKLGGALDTDGWTAVFNGVDLDGWKQSDDATWKVDKGCIVGSGKRGHLFSPRSDYKNFELKARAQINDNGNSGLYFRTTFGPGWPQGYEAQVNSTYKDPVKTGSLYSFDNINAMFIEPGIWFEYHVVCRDVEKGVHITIRVNGFKVVDFVDTKRTNASGHIAVQQHHEGSVVKMRDIRIREF